MEAAREKIGGERERPDQGLKSSWVGEDGGASAPLSWIHLHAFRRSLRLWGALLFHVSISTSVPICRVVPAVSLIVQGLLHVLAARVCSSPAIHGRLCVQAVRSRHHLYELTHLCVREKLA